jgi:hypothetical protein
MPRIPIITSQQVAPTPLRPAQASQRALQTQAQSAFMVARTGEQIASAFGDFALQQKRKATATLKQRSFNELRQFSQDLEYGENGFRRAHGENALVREQESIAELEGFRNELAGKISNEQARDEWIDETTGFTLDFQRRAAAHSMREQDALSRQEFEVGMERATEDALADLADFDADPNAMRNFGLTMARQEDLFTQRAFEMGWTNDAGTGLSDWAQQRIAQWKSGVLMTAVDSLIAQDKGVVADELFQAAKEQEALLPSDELKLAPRIEPAKDRERAIQRVSELFQGVDEFYSADDFQRVTGAIINEPDAGQKSLMMNEMRNRFMLLNTLRAQRDQENYGRMWSQLDQNPDIGKLRLDTYWDNLDPTLQSRLEARAHQLTTGVEPETSPEAWVQWHFVPISDDQGQIVGYRRKTPKEKEAENLMMYRPIMSDTDWNQIIREQDGYAAGTAAYPKAIESIKTEFDRQMKLWDGEELDINEKAFLEGKLVDRATAVLNDPGRPGGNKRPLSADEQTEIIDEVMRPVFAPGGWWFFGGRHGKKFPAGFAGAMSPETRSSLSIPLEQIPQDQRLALEQFLRDHRVGVDQEVSEKLIEDTFGQITVGADPEAQRFIDRQVAQQNQRAMRDARVIASDIVSAGDAEEEDISPAFLADVMDSMREQGWNTDDPIQVRNAVDIIRDANNQAFTEAARRQKLTGGTGAADATFDRMIRSVSNTYWNMRMQEGMTDLQARKQLGVPGGMSLLTPFGQETGIPESGVFGPQGEGPGEAVPQERGVEGATE